MYLSYYLTIVISGTKEPIVVSGVESIVNIKKTIHSYLKSIGTKPKYIKENVPYFDSFLFVDEFCVTFLDWIKQHDCGCPECDLKQKLEAFTNDLIEKTLNKTVYFIDGRISPSDYKLYQTICDLLHLGMTIESATTAAARICNMVVISNSDEFTSKLN